MSLLVCLWCSFPCQYKDKKQISYTARGSSELHKTSLLSAIIPLLTAQACLWLQPSLPGLFCILSALWHKNMAAQCLSTILLVAIFKYQKVGRKLYLIEEKSWMACGLGLILGTESYSQRYMDGKGGRYNTIFVQCPLNLNKKDCYSVFTRLSLWGLSRNLIPCQKASVVWTS